MKHTFFFLSLAMTLSSVSSAAAPEQSQPNILYFYVDDMGWGSIGPNGQDVRRDQNLPSVRTPNIDRLAAEGVNFRRGYACTVCSPSRASQQTGFHQGHTFSDRNDPDNAKKAIRSDDLTMGDVLSQAGYTTGYWGKWGYGGSRDMNHPVIENIQTLPTSHGYQHVLAELHHIRAHSFFQPTLWSAPAGPKAIGGLELIPNSLNHQKNNSKYPDLPARQNHPQYPANAYCDDSYAFAALDFVREQGQRSATTGKPFFALLAAQIPHAPFGDVSTLPEWDADYRDDPHFQKLAEQSQQWAAMVTRIDAHFGNILSALEDPNSDGDTSDSIANNTLVIFQSDNGGPSGKNNQQLDANGGLRDVKGSIYEGGIRVPLVMKWPSQIHKSSLLKAGSHSDMVVDITDLLPTFCELAGVATPVGIDGVSIAPTLTGKGTQRKREFIVHEAGNNQSIIRGDFKLILSKKGKPQLYNLKTDPAEQRNIADQSVKLVRELNEILIAERVTEPKGFANTYHNWTGPNEGNAAVADHWSDYVYSNSGVTYMTDAGSPQLSWVARIQNASTMPNIAIAKSDLAFLGLEIGGNANASAAQTLRVTEGASVTGRNEIRIGQSGILELSEGRVSSLRWVDVMEGGVLEGRGTVGASIHNSGTISLNQPSKSSLKIERNFQQSATGRLQLQLPTQNSVSVVVGGTAQLDGTLEVLPSDTVVAAINQPLTILSAESITGRFANPDDIVRVADRSYTIQYADAEIRLQPR